MISEVASAIWSNGIGQITLYFISYFVYRVSSNDQEFSTRPGKVHRCVKNNSGDFIPVIGMHKFFNFLEIYAVEGTFLPECNPPRRCLTVRLIIR